MDGTLACCLLPLASCLLPNFSEAKIQPENSFVKSVLNFFRIRFNTNRLKALEFLLWRKKLTINS